MFFTFFIAFPKTALFIKLKRQAFQLFQSSSSQVKIVNHYEVHVVFQGIEHRRQENALHHFFSL